LKLTPKGVELGGNIDEIIFSWVAAVSNDISEAERATFYSVLSKIADNLQSSYIDNQK
jgi:hypothetical protein